MVSEAEMMAMMAAKDASISTREKGQGVEKDVEEGATIVTVAREAQFNALEARRTIRMTPEEAVTEERTGLTGMKL